MARILLKTTIPSVADDWHIGRFSLLTAHLRSLGHEVETADRRDDGGHDIDLERAADGRFDQLWLFGTDVTGALTDRDINNIALFRGRGGGLLFSRDHQDVGACVSRIPAIGMTQNFQTTNPESDEARRCIDDTGSPNLSWPNYHSGNNGDAQEIAIVGDLHPIVARADGEPIRYLPAHPHEGAVSVPPDLSKARVIACGRSSETGRRFNLVIAIEGADGEGRAVSDSSFHHFADCNWDPRLGAPTFVVEPWGKAMIENAEAATDARRYAENIATWLS